MLWDSCVFIRYLTQTPLDLVNEITQYIADVQAKKRRVYFSSFGLYRDTAALLKAQGIVTLQEFFADLGATFIPIDPNPNILMMAGQMWDVDSTNPGDPRMPGRTLGTPDSIHLATCLYLRDTLGIEDIVFGNCNLYVVGAIGRSEPRGFPPRPPEYEITEKDYFDSLLCRGAASKRSAMPRRRPKSVNSASKSASESAMDHNCAAE